MGINHRNEWSNQVLMSLRLRWYFKANIHPRANFWKSYLNSFKTLWDKTHSIMNFVTFICFQMFTDFNLFSNVYVWFAVYCFYFSVMNLACSNDADDSSLFKYCWMIPGGNSECWIYHLNLEFSQFWVEKSIQSFKVLSG